MPRELQNICICWETISRSPIFFLQWYWSFGCSRYCQTKNSEQNILLRHDYFYYLVLYFCFFTVTVPCCDSLIQKCLIKLFAIEELSIGYCIPHKHNVMKITRLIRLDKIEITRVKSHLAEGLELIILGTPALPIPRRFVHLAQLWPLWPQKS